MRLVSTLLTFFLLLSCGDVHNMPVHPILKDCAAIKIYRINWPHKDAFGPLLVMDDGSLNPERIPLEGVTLNGERTQQLLAMLLDSHPEYEQSKCFLPHHAFEFLDQHGQRIGSLDLCFMCSVHQSDLDDISTYIDLPGIKNMLRELNIPIENPDW